MPIYQEYNGRIKAWVKYEFTKKGFKPINVKQIKPKIKFKGVPVRGKKLRKGGSR